MGDIDDFKSYNDRLGHLEGDEAIKDVAGVFQVHARRPADTAARFGGEEFTLILPDTDAEGAREVAENIRRNINELRIEHPASPAGYLTVSMGISTHLPGDEDCARQLISEADQAMYRGKRSGKNRVLHFSDP